MYRLKSQQQGCITQNEPLKPGFHTFSSQLGFKFCLGEEAWFQCIKSIIMMGYHWWYTFAIEYEGKTDERTQSRKIEASAKNRWQKDFSV